MSVAGIGVDLVEIDRIAAMYERHGSRLLARLFTTAEAEYCMTHRDPAHHLAVRLAAKEAAFKALAGTMEAREIGWKELEVRRSWAGVPELVMHGRAHERGEALGITRVHLSLTHSRNVAAAVVVMERD